MEHLEKNNLLSQNHFGFLQKLQWYGSLIKYVDRWMLVCLQAPFMLMSKAFDTVGHEGIINKLPDYDITVMPREWIIDYLFNRCQQVTFQNTL